VSAGSPFVVGEEGPELFVPGHSGTIVPNGKWGSVVVQQSNHFHGDLRAAARAEVATMLPQIAEASRRGVLESRARGRG
jgi:phage-related minor tail protein